MQIEDKRKQNKQKTTGLFPSKNPRILFTLMVTFGDVLIPLSIQLIWTACFTEPEYYFIAYTLNQHL